MTDNSSFTVGGVYKDFPANSVIQNAVYKGINGKVDQDNWNANGYQLYVLLDDPNQKDQIIANFKKHLNRQEYDWETRDVRLTQLTDIYYEADSQFDSLKDKGNRTLVLILFTVALLIVFIAGINFTNFSNALVPIRVRSINTQKILGGSDRILRCAMLVEAVMICLVSFVISLFIVRGMANTWLADMISGDMSLASNIPLLALTGIFGHNSGSFSGGISCLAYHFFFSGIGVERFIRVDSCRKKIKKSSYFFPVCHLFCIDHSCLVYLSAESLYGFFFFGL